MGSRSANGGYSDPGNRKKGQVHFPLLLFFRLQLINSHGIAHNKRRRKKRKAVS